MTLPIYISENDARRLQPLVQNALQQPGPVAGDLKRLEAELLRANIVPEHELPADAVTMNSTVEVEDLEDGEKSTYTLVYPEQANADQGRISILAPLGMAMLGYRAGDEFKWPVPGGTAHMKILRVLERTQPPALSAQLIQGNGGH